MRKIIKKNNFEIGYKPKKCKICRKEYKPKCSTAKYCSKDCRRLGRNKTNRILRKKPKLIKICQYCENKFITARKNQKVCKNCFYEHSKKKKRQYYRNVLKPKFGYLNRGQSYPQKYIFNVLCNLFPKYKWSFNDRGTIRNPETNHTLELDIWCKSKKIAVEYDGQHHFLPIFGNNKLQYVKNLDMLKNKLCETYGIKLIRISYNDPWNDKKWLEQTIKESLDFPTGNGEY